MKDFFDIAWCAQHLDFDGAELISAVQATFERRHTTRPRKLPFALTPAFATDGLKQAQWGAFLHRTRLEAPLSLEEVVDRVAGFVGPAFAAAEEVPRGLRWPAGGPWGA